MKSRRDPTLNVVWYELSAYNAMYLKKFTELKHKQLNCLFMCWRRCWDGFYAVVAIGRGKVLNVSLDDFLSNGWLARLV